MSIIQWNHGVNGDFEIKKYENAYIFVTRLRAWGRNFGILEGDSKFDLRVNLKYVN